MCNLLFKFCEATKPLTKGLSYSLLIILTLITTASISGDLLNRRFIPLHQLIEKSIHLNTNREFASVKIYRNIQEELILFLDKRKWTEIITPEILNATSPDHLIDLYHNSDNILHRSLLRSLGMINYTRQ